MNRQMFNAMAAQYATPEISGDGLVSWDSGKKCVIPSIELYGAAVQDGEPTPENPVMPVCNNGVFASRGRNLLKDSAVSHSGNTRDGYTVSGWAKEFVNNENVIAMLKPNTQYTIRYKFRLDSLAEGTTAYIQNNHGMLVLYSGLGYATVSFFDLYLDTVAEANTWQIGTIVERARTFTTPAGLHDAAANYRIIYYTRRSMDGTAVAALEIGTFFDIQIELGDTATPYTPYYDGGQAQAPELWAIPGTEYRDEWDPKAGRGIRRVKKLVLTPDLNWQVFYVGENGFNFAYISPVPKPENAIDGMFSHGKYDSVATANNINSACVYPNAIVRVRVGREASVDDFKAFLQEQIDANTPVTVWYALAEPEPFTTAPAKLTMPTGHGQIIQVSGDVPDCLISAKYLTHS